MQLLVRKLSVLLLSCLYPFVSGDAELFSSEPLHQQVDRLVEAVADGPLNPPADDATFARRVYLDFAGRIPTVQEARQFLAAQDPEKRSKLIEQLLAGPDYPRHLQQVFDVMLMERRGEDQAWQSYLREAFRTNKPWNQIASEILNPNADDEATRASAYFYTKRLEKYGQNPVDYPGLVRDVGRLMLGIDVQCAQCHDHLFVDDYKQSSYQGLYAFLGNTMVRSDVKFPAVAEKPLLAKVSFQSVFDMEEMVTGPRLLGLPELDVPKFKQGEEFSEPPDRKTKFPGKPKFSTLEKLAEQLPSDNNPSFSRNIVNRLWWLMMGRGLVEPLDLHHRDNPPSHPELLDLLAQEFIQHDYDIRWLLGELARTQTYQRSSFVPDPDNVPPPTSYRVALERPLIAEQILSSTLLATGTDRQFRDKDGKLDEEQLSATRDLFMKALANPAREPKLEFTPSVRSALFLSNNDTVLSWLKPQAENLVARLNTIADDQQFSDELFLSVLSRQPSPEEVAEIAKYLRKNERAVSAIGEVVWALLCSTEFHLNH